MKNHLCYCVRHVGVTLILTFICTGAIAQRVVNPTDQPLLIQAKQAAAVDAAIAPHILEAQKSYPEAKLRFLKGLPSGQSFFVTTRLRDTKGHSERVFVRVVEIRGTSVFGSIADDVVLVDGFKIGQRFSVKESEIIDWLIARPDGTEEGNFVGKFLDTYVP